jgi:Na+/H+ antiporter NhaC
MRDIFNQQIKTPLKQYSLVPFLVFIFLYVASGCWFLYNGQDMAFYQFPAAACAFFGFLVALVIGYKNINEHINTFTLGIGEHTVITMCLIFLLAGGFSALAKSVGAIDAAVNLGLFLLPNKLLLPGLFIISCFISLAMGTSMGTISTVIPIAIGISQQSSLNIALVAGVVVSGAMFGDNLSVISDTTIAATQTQGCNMRDKTKENFFVAIISASIVCLILLFFSSNQTIDNFYSIEPLKVLPYILVLFLALLGVHVFVVLMLGILSCLLIGIINENFVFFEVGQIIYSGFLSMADVFFVTIFISGLAALASKEGGLEYILNKISHLAKGQKSAQLLIAVSVSISDICVANNTVAILLSGNIAKNIAAKFNISKAKAASILDIYSCVWQGIIPHGAQLLLACGLCKMSSFAIMPYTFYPIILGIVASLQIIFGKKV